MSFIDKARHKAEEVIGEIKEKVGDLTNNDELKAEGRGERAGGEIKQTGDSLKDAASNVGNTLKRDKH